ncbi:MAG: AtpZ/AtpI family protein [Planctomycetales bacterium]|nr:AtpZ/AtpI family protein [Planctomycetales bacterium]
MSSDQNRDGRSSLAQGYVLASRVISIGLQMALPPSGGWWLDKRLGTSPWFTIAGVMLGFMTSMFDLLRLAKSSGRSSK